MFGWSIKVARLNFRAHAGDKRYTLCFGNLSDPNVPRLSAPYFYAGATVRWHGWHRLVTVILQRNPE